LVGFTGCLHLWWPLLPMGFTLSHTRSAFKHLRAIILLKTRVSCYSHHLSQFALHETNWLFRVSKYNPYLNPYLIIHITAPPWTLTKRFMELRPSPTTPPWDLTKRFMKLRPSHTTPPWNLTKSFMELRQYSYQSHVSQTHHRFIKHTNLMPISNQSTHPYSCIYSYQAHQFQSIQSDNTCIFTYFML